MKKALFLIIASCLMLVAALPARAQSSAENYRYLNRKEKKANAEKMLATQYDFFEMTDDEVLAVRKEIRYYGNYFGKVAGRKRITGYALVPVGIAAGIAGLATKSALVSVGGVAASVGGIVLAVSGEVDKDLSESCLAKARGLYVQTSLAPASFDTGMGQLAFGARLCINF